jgi:Na+-driven multidrug efflux pump
MRLMAKQHLPNAVCGVLDYAAYPVGMLLVAPVILRYLGVERYGVWAVATAAISAGSILASGFGDANIQQIASDRGAGDSSRLLQTVRSTMGIHVVLGLCIGLIGWMLSPYVARHVVAHDAALETDCLWSLRIASVVMLVRAIESVCISTQRAFERYGPAVYVSIAGRLLSLALAAVLACVSRSVAGIFAASLVVIVASVWMQLGRLRLLLGAVSLGPQFDRDSFRALFHFGIFSWLQALAAIIVGQADRLVAGVALGAAAVASYALCVQIAQPLYGLTSSGLHFLFPHLAGRRVTSSAAMLRKIVGRAFLVNLGMTAVGTALLLALGTRVVRALAGDAIAAAAAPVLPLIVWGTALLGDERHGLPCAAGVWLRANRDVYQHRRRLRHASAAGLADQEPRCARNRYRAHRVWGGGHASVRSSITASESGMVIEGIACGFRACPVRRTEEHGSARSKAEQLFRETCQRSGCSGGSARHRSRSITGGRSPREP